MGAIIAPPGHWRLTRERPPVVIAIANWNRCDLLRRCVSSLREHTDYPHHRICIFDQGSSDGSVEFLRTLEPDVDVVYSPDNIGFTRASNIVIERYPAWDVVLLNNDAQVGAGWLSALVATATAADEIGLVGGRLVSSRGVLQEAGGEVFADGRVRARGRGESASDPRFQERRLADYCSAACLFVKRTVLDRCGALDRAYEAGYYEDVELAFKAMAAGFAVLYEPRCLVIHDEHSSFGGAAAGALMRRHRETFRSRWAEHLAARRHSPFELEDRGRPRLLLVTELLPGNTLSPRMRRIRQLMRELSAAFQMAYLNAVTNGLDRYAPGIEELGVAPFYVPLNAAPGVTGLDEEELMRVNYFPVAICGNPDAASFLRTRFPAEMLDATSVVVDVGLEVDVAAAAARSGATSFVVATETQRRLLLAAMPLAACALLPFQPEPSPSRIPSRETRTDIVVLGDNFDAPAPAAAFLRMMETLVPALRARLPHSPICVGGGSLPPALLACAFNRFEVLPSATPVGTVLDRARVVVIPQHWCSPDTLSNIAEARARSVPVVTSSAVLDVAGLLDDTGGGFSAETPTAFVEHIVRICSDTWAWNALVQAQAVSSDQPPAEELAPSLAAWVASETRLAAE